MSKRIKIMSIDEQWTMRQFNKIETFINWVKKHGSVRGTYYKNNIKKEWFVNYDGTVNIDYRPNWY